MVSTSPVQNRVSDVFIPVSNIEAARDWYCGIFGLEPDCEIIAGHLCVLPVTGETGIILDSMPKWTLEGEDRPRAYMTPAIMLYTDDIHASYTFMNERGVELVTEIENGHWFVFHDLDGNKIMVCA